MGYTRRQAQMHTHASDKIGVLVTHGLAAECDQTACCRDCVGCAVFCQRKDICIQKWIA